MSERPYARPRLVSDLADCLFYHTLDLPGYGTVPGTWDLRGGIERYLGGASLDGKRVLDVGAASGFVTFQMEARGADVVAFDLSEDHSWDVVPLAGDDGAFAKRRRDEVRRINNGFWLAHRALGSRARMVYGTAYAVPAAIGPVDVAVLGCVLPHLRDPFRALESALRLTRETAIVTGRASFEPEFRAGAGAVFMPAAGAQGPRETWWQLSAGCVQRMLGVLGFTDSSVTLHQQLCEGRPEPLFTVVARKA